MTLDRSSDIMGDAAEFELPSAGRRRAWRRSRELLLEAIASKLGGDVP